ncbi:MAG: hypothetical protein RQ982_08300 [Gammaproteobacteria bacterium]|nr:hypothetical protein [Gammaproteobacteria bacterium]
MYEKHSKSDTESYVLQRDSENKLKETLLPRLPELSHKWGGGYLEFAFYCVMLIVPLYATLTSVLENDWVMVIIDVLFIPVGFVHGVLLLTGALC